MSFHEFFFILIGVIDLYGQAAQATIIDLSDYRSPDGPESEATSATLYSGGILENCNDLKFHHLHGRNARINNNGLTASRPNALSEFNDAIIMSNRPLRDGELFEIVIERMVERWSGCIEGMPILYLQQRARKFEKVLRQRSREIKCLHYFHEFLKWGKTHFIVRKS